MKKHVLQIPAHLFIGGVERVARDIGLYADPQEYDTHYIVFDKEIGEYEADVLAHGCRIFRLQEPSLDYQRFFSDMKRIMSETRYDVVHAHTMFNIGWCMKLAREAGVPKRIAHAHSALTNNGGAKVRAYEALMRHYILRDATDLIACGEKAGIRLFGERAYRQRTELILNGIDTERFRYDESARAAIRSKHGLQDSFVIGHVGHLLDVKNQSFLLELMPEILSRRSNAKLVMLGEGPDRAKLENKIAELGLQNHVIMTGNVSNVNEYLSAMDVFAFPSLYEGMPLSIVEVQANGLPCILSTGVPKDVYLTDLVSPLSLEQPEKWADAILAAQRKDPTQYAAQLRDRGFDTESAMKKIYAIYES